MTTSSLLSWSRLRGLASALLGAALLFGCGGGGGVGTGGTGSITSYASGPIEGFGSIFVSGVEFEDTGASVLDDEGDNVARNGSELRLGMTVEIDATAIVGGGTGKSATATTVRIATGLVGPVAAIDTAAGTLTVFGQQLKTDSATVFGSGLANGLASLTVGQVVQVWALPEATAGVYRITRIETVSGNPQFVLRGVVSNLDTTAKTFKIGNSSFSYANATGVPADLANGSMVRVKLAATPVGGVWTVNSFGKVHQRPANRDGAEVEGLVSSFSSLASFVVNGQTVDASSATVTGTVAAGVSVEVEGSLVNGVLVARTVAVTHRGGGHGDDYILVGTVSSLDTTAKTFVTRGQLVSYASAAFSGGSAADLSNGTRVKVTGGVSADGTRIVATTVEIR